MHSNPFPKKDGSEFTGKYANLKAATVKNLGLVVQVNMPKVGSGGKSPDNFFESKYMEKEVGGPAKFSAAQYHFHVKSEHTINGKRYDMEMHTVHLAGGSTIQASQVRRRMATFTNPSDGSGKIDHFASAVGIIFDRDDYDPTITVKERKIIDSFFDALNFEKTPVGSSYPETLATNVDIPYGDLMKIAKLSYLQV